MIPINSSLILRVAALIAFAVLLVPAQQAVAQGDPNSPATGQPTISGTARVGEVLVADRGTIADPDGMTGATLEYLWVVDPVQDLAVGAYDYRSTYNIDSYVVRPDDVDRTVQVVVTFTDDQGNAESRTSEPTALVQPTPPDFPWSLEVSTETEGTLFAQWEEPRWSPSLWWVLRITLPTLRGDGGRPVTGYTVQWIEDGGSWTVPAEVTEAATTGFSHTIPNLDPNKYYRVRVFATNALGDGTPSFERRVKPDGGVVVSIPSTIVTGGGGGGGGGGASGPTPSTRDFEWTVKHDLKALDNANGAPTGMWSDGATLWLANNPDGAGDAVYAYDLASGERAGEREFALHGTNRAPRGVWALGTTMWVSDSGRDRLFAYDLESGEPLPEREIELTERNGDARGIWSDGQTLWVLDAGEDSLFAYDLESGGLLGEYALDSRNSDPQGIWSDRVTIWISDAGASPRSLFAYRLPVPADEQGAGDGNARLNRVRDEDFTELSGASNNSPRGVWSDGDFMYVVDASDGKVYTYNMPDSIDTRLASLTLSGVDLGEFDPGQTDYEGVIGEGVMEAVVAAEAMQRRTDVVIDPPDADEATPGHQVSLQGVDTIAVTVTSADGSRTRVYRVNFEPTVTELALNPGWTSFEWPGADGAPLTDLLPDTVVAVYTWDEAAGRWLAYFPAIDDEPGLHTLTAFSAGATYWVAVEEALTWVVPASAGDQT